jgi:hypothetical protein
MSIVLAHGTAQYRVVAQVAEAAVYRLYVCEDVASGRQCLLQIATETVHNGGLERAAFILKELKRTSDLFQADYAKKSPGKSLRYDRLFPALIDSFVADEQGKRRINILAFTDVDTVTTMVPLSNLLVRDRLLIDLETSAWIMGRLLKLLMLAHSQGIAVQVLSGNNVLINPEQHFTVVFDWSGTYTYQQEVPGESRKADIAQAATTVLTAIGENSETSGSQTLTDEPQQYVNFLRELANRRHSSAERAHRQFYDLVNELFGDQFHPFTTLPA